MYFKIGLYFSCHCYYGHAKVVYLQKFWLVSKTLKIAKYISYFNIKHISILNIFHKTSKGKDLCQ